MAEAISAAIGCQLLLAAGFLLVYLAVTILSPLRAFFSLTVLHPIDSLFIGTAAPLWSLIQRWLWSAHTLERLLHLNWEEGS